MSSPVSATTPTARSSKCRITPGSFSAASSSTALSPWREIEWIALDPSALYAWNASSPVTVVHHPAAHRQPVGEHLVGEPDAFEGVDPPRRQGEVDRSPAAPAERGSGRRSYSVTSWPRRDRNTASSGPARPAPAMPTSAIGADPEELDGVVAEQAALDVGVEAARADGLRRRAPRPAGTGSRSRAAPTTAPSRRRGSAAPARRTPPSRPRSGRGTRSAGRSSGRGRRHGGATRSPAARAGT